MRKDCGFTLLKTFEASVVTGELGEAWENWVRVFTSERSFLLLIEVCVFVLMVFFLNEKCKEVLHGFNVRTNEQ